MKRFFFICLLLVAFCLQAAVPLTRKILPTLAKKNVRNRYLMNLESLCQFSLGKISPDSYDFHYLSLCKFGFNTIASRWFSSLRHAVGGVIFARSKKQMVGANTGPIVAAMKDAEIVVDGAIVNYPRQPMSKDMFAFSPSNTGVTVSVLVGLECPRPTTISFAHVTPKSYENRFRKTLRNQVVERMRSLHQSVRLIVCHALGSLNRKGISFCIP